MKEIMIALAGQPNGGKSTVFNALTGAKQFVANYPGVTVDKMSGWYNRNGVRVEVIDLPGTYSLTSFSPEERVARSVLLYENPAAVINVVDASNLKRGLYLTLQLLEMGLPLLLDLNMMDVAEKAGIRIDAAGLSRELGVPVVETIMRNTKGKDKLLEIIDEVAFQPHKAVARDVVLYPELADSLKQLEAAMAEDVNLKSGYPLAWLAVKLLENDTEVADIIRKSSDGQQILHIAQRAREEFEAKHEQKAELYIYSRRNQTASELASRFTASSEHKQASRSASIDRFVCHRVLGPIILLGVIYMLYRLSIVEGYKLTNYTWPILAWVRSTAESILPAPGFITVPIFREFVLWCIDSINALLNYIPIFFILFGLIAMLEDSGYMPRMAFIMDRILSRFGLHGQSTLSMVLSGVMVGGCVVPGVMSTKGIPDEKSRLATILTLPMLNCLAKVPMYILLINIYFADQKASVMFFISTISLLFVLPVAKILSLTVLRDKPTAPFIMEMPPYHIPTLRGVIGRAIERVLLYIRKIVTVVAAVAVVLFALLQFPGIDAESLAAFEARKNTAVTEFLQSTEGNPLAGGLKTEDDVLSLIVYNDDYRAARRNATTPEQQDAMEQQFKQRNPEFFEIITSKKDRNARNIEKELRGVILERRTILLEMRQKRIENSFLGTIGRSLEPVSQYAGFNWRVNIAVLSSLAAKESMVATLGSLYQEGQDDDSADSAATSLESRMSSQETTFTPLHAVALMMFMVLCPPCFPTAIAIKIQTGSFRWMLFSFLYPLTLGLLAAAITFTGGNALGLSGMQAMWTFYLIPLVLTVIMGFVGNGKKNLVYENTRRHTDHVG